MTLGVVAVAVMLAVALAVLGGCVTFGEERPADPGHDEAAWARNRRVEFGQER